MHRRTRIQLLSWGPRWQAARRLFALHRRRRKRAWGWELQEMISVQITNRYAHLGVRGRKKPELDPANPVTVRLRTDDGRVLWEKGW